MHDVKVIILCGGMGTRLREETEYKPKPMVEIGGKPILWHIMKHYAHFGYKDFVLALGYKGNVIRNYFLNYNFYNTDFTVDLGDNGRCRVHPPSIEEDWRVTLVETGPDSMTGYRVKLCGKYITGDRFMLTYGDAVSDVDLAELDAFHRQMDTLGVVTAVTPPSRFGDLVVTENRVTAFKQKQFDPFEQSPINGGYFVFKREFLDLIPDDPSCSIEAEPMSKIVANGQLAAFPHRGFWQCMDTFRDSQLLEKMWRENPAWKVW